MVSLLGDMTLHLHMQLWLRPTHSFAKAQIQLNRAFRSSLIKMMGLADKGQGHQRGVYRREAWIIEVGRGP